MDPSKVEAMSSLKQPRNPTEVWSFLGLARNYRRFLDEFLKIATPIMTLTCKNVNLNGRMLVNRVSKSRRNDW